MKESLIIMLIGAIMITVGIISLNHGITRQEKYECNKWEKESLKLKGYSLTDWQKKQCEQYN